MKNRSKPPKYAALMSVIREIIEEDECNDTYGYKRIYNALLLKREKADGDFPRIPSQTTMHRLMKCEGLLQKLNSKRNRIIFPKIENSTQKSADLLNRDFYAENPYEKCVCDITEVACLEGKLYISILADCFNNEILGLSMADNMRTELVCNTLSMAVSSHPEMRSNNAIVHSDRGRQYTSGLYRRYIEMYGIRQSMTTAKGRCNDNAKCESIFSRFKTELLYGRYDTKKIPMETVKALIWQYFTDYWNNRRISSADNGLPPAVKKRRYYDKLKASKI